MRLLDLVALLTVLMTAVGLPGYAIFYLAFICHYFVQTVDPSFIARFAEVAISYGHAGWAISNFTAEENKMPTVVFSDMCVAWINVSS